MRREEEYQVVDVHLQGSGVSMRMCACVCARERKRGAELGG